MLGPCDARPTCTFPITGHHCPLNGTSLLLGDRYMCASNLLKVVPESEMAGSRTYELLSHKSSALTITPLLHRRKHVIEVQAATADVFVHSSLVCL